MTIIDETTNGVAKTGVSRRHFIQGAAATAAGAALPVAGIVGSGAASAAQAKTLRIATGKQLYPAAPWRTMDGSLFIIGATGEWLCWQTPDFKLEPRIATSWKSSNGGKTWTFKIRQGVKFSDGTPLTVDDVVYTFQSVWNATSLFTKKKHASKGNFTGIMSGPNQVVKVDAETVRFDLDIAKGNFPYDVSSMSYGLCIIKNGVDGSDAWTKDMITAGPWKMTSYTEYEKTTFTKNPYYWDKDYNCGFENLELIQFTSAATAIPQLKTGKLDVIGAMEAADAAKIDKSKFDITSLNVGAGLGHVHLRADFGPFKDKRVRQAAALTIDREGYVKGVMKGVGGLVGNDNVMTPYPDGAKSVAQRKMDIAKAKELMKAAGVPNGFSCDLSTWKRDDFDKYAQLIKTSFKKIGINVTLKIDGSAGGNDVYYAGPYDSVKGKVLAYDNNSWMASTIGITDWAGRGVPDQYLMREYHSAGDWNDAHIWDDSLDAAISAYLGAMTPAKKKETAKKIAEISLDLTPYILAYTSNAIGVRRKGLTGISANGMGQYNLKGAKG
jgi:peptide/nickel transport system substrate-binding protein